MCLAAFAIHASARWPLVIASNRDESFDRPALPLAQWKGKSGQSIISGRDGQAGGTWLGMTGAGRVALLTNVRERTVAPAGAYPRSRGELVLRWLEGDMDAAQFMKSTERLAFGGFNLVLGDWQTGNWSWLSNRKTEEAEAETSAAHQKQGAGWHMRALPPGVYGLSNAALDTPWPKTIALKSALAESLQADPNASDGNFPEARLWAALASRNPAPPGNMPDTGVPLAVERALSSAFVDLPERRYGTRCSSVLVASALPNEGRCRVSLAEITHHKSATGHQSQAGAGTSVLRREAVEWDAPRLPPEYF